MPIDDEWNWRWEESQIRINDYKDQAKPVKDSMSSYFWLFLFKNVTQLNI